MEVFRNDVVKNVTWLRTVSVDAWVTLRPHYESHSNRIDVINSNLLSWNKNRIEFPIDMNTIIQRLL